MSEQIHIGQDLPEFKAGHKRPSVWSAEDMERIRKWVNALAHAQVSPDTAGQFHVSDGNLILELFNQAAGGGGGTLVLNWGKIGGAANSYGGYSATFATADTVTGGQSASSTGNNDKWDAVQCDIYDPTRTTMLTEAGVAFAALRPELRPTEHQIDTFGDGTEITYTYSDPATYGDFSRTAAWTDDYGSHLITQAITPPYLVGEWVPILQATTGVLISGTDVGYQIWDARNWAVIGNYPAS